MATGLQDRFELENRYVSRDGRTIHGRLTATLLRNAAGKPHLAIGMVEEITERKLHEEIRQQAYRQIERNMEQFAILGDHVRHPLQVILARADLMDDEETAEQIREQVRRINALIRQLDEGWVESRKIREFLRRNDLL
ncbi:sensory transduction histidine kinase [hydrocarbon metagenome]|uniref:Sensory transduction histidine kinase n=1 Tax=hydrocarbon metagenome TaxID=938273 RepID=A0A0W8FDY1_9ZZZZ